MDYANPSIPDILLISLIGFLTVFIVLIVLMGIIMLISKVFAEKKEVKPSAPATVETAPEKEDVKVDAYTGVKLYGVSDKDAAILMAIVADKLGKPLDNLRFISIREVK